MILRHSGVSRGSLYHHFNDLADLIETALVRIFTRTVDENISLMANLLETSSSPAEFNRSIELFNEVTQAPARRAVRFERARLLGMAYNNPRLTAGLAIQQTRLTQSYADLFKKAQERGYFRDDFDPKAAAVLIQAYTLGKIVDDIGSDPVPQEVWNDLIVQLIRRMFGGELGGRSVGV